MKRNINLAFILFLLCSTFYAKAQGQRTVEIVTSDTISLKAISFVFKISAGNEDNGMFGAMASMMGKGNVDEVKNSLLIDSVERMLKENHYHYTSSTENKYTLGKSDKSSVLMVTFTSEGELEVLCKKLSKLQSLKGTIENVAYENPDAYLPAMFSRLYSAASKQASDIAKISGGSIGKVLTITEISSTSNAASPYESIMSEMMKKTPFSAMNDATGNLTKIYSRKVSFRFELN